MNPLSYVDDLHVKGPKSTTPPMVVHIATAITVMPSF